MKTKTRILTCLRRFLFLAVLSSFAPPQVANCQLPSNASVRSSFLQSSKGSDELNGPTMLAINMFIGGLTAAAWHRSRDHSVWRQVARGSVAGGIVFAGKRLIAEENPWVWWTGREIAALGSSEVLNAAEGRAVLDRLTLPIGPLHVHISRSVGPHVSPRLDLATAIRIAELAAGSENRFAWRESFAVGAPVFISEKVTGGIATHSAGAIQLSQYVPDGIFPGFQRKRAVLSHELIHATQYDFISITWGNPIEDAVARRIGIVGRVHRYVDFGVLEPAQLLLNAVIPARSRPWEKEASAMESGY